jgi:preprotein translocase subunit SecG
VNRFASSGANKMMDVIMLAIGLGFFVLSVGYCYACDRL